MSARHALAQLDSKWFSEQRPRFMDLLGDYAGKELFVVDGDSLLQHVFADPLLALGRPNDNAFQFLHACYSVERFLKELVTRGCVFEVAFWEDNRYVTIRTGMDKFVHASRRLGRVILKRHIQNLPGITVVSFDGLSDPRSAQYFTEKRPVFVMCNDGGLPAESADPPSDNLVLIQRAFMLELLTNSVVVASLSAAEFRDTKVLSFVYERIPRAGQNVKAAGHKVLELLNRAEALFDVLPAVISTSSRQWLVAACQRFNRLQTELEELSLPLLFVFISMSVVVDVVPVADRAQTRRRLPAKLEDYLRSSLLPVLFPCIEAAISANNVVPMIDGHIFLALLHEIGTHRSTGIRKILGDTLYARVESIWAQAGLPAVDFQPLCDLFLGFNPDLIEFPPSAKTFSLLPFENPLFNEHLTSIQVTTTRDSLDTSKILSTHEFGGGSVFNDIRHWHNSKTILPKHLGGVDAKPPKGRERMKWHRRNQRFMKNLLRQAQSLTGAKGAPLHQSIIAPVGTRRIQKPKVKPLQVKKSKAPPPLKSADRLRLQIQEEKRESRNTEGESWWKEQLLQLEKLSIKERIERLELMSRNKKLQADWLNIERRLYRLHCECRLWIEDESREEPATRDQFTVSLLRIVIETRNLEGITPAAVAILKNVLIAIGLECYHITPEFKKGAPDRPLAFKFVKLVSKDVPVYGFMSIMEDPINWQLRLYGDFMDRSFDSKPDPRVHFEPDGWQREVLDKLDRDESILVVAPTSAGKTFISYYAMEKVLREADDSILVYIAPTKALVTQIAAEVSARFRKELKGKTCWAIHTRDQRINNPQKTQILITVPEMLAIMLLSPTLSRVWIPRIKRIILDEIHSIGQQEGGQVWEQILLLAPCPIIGLSATIGEAEVFNDWLASVQQVHGFKHSLVIHPYRYSHLRKFTYLVPEKAPEFVGLTRQQPTNNLRFLHPISFLASGGSMPDDLALEARDCLTLYAAMAGCSNDPVIVNLQPTKFFQNTGTRLLQQQDIIRYELALKAELRSWMAASDFQEPSSRFRMAVGRLQDQDPPLSPSYENGSDSGPFLDNLIHLVTGLHQRGDLPAILFSFDRHLCELMVKGVLKSLQQAEDKWRKSNPQWQAKMEKWQQWKDSAKERERAGVRAKRQRKDKHETEEVGDNENPLAAFNPDDPSPEFSFANFKSTYSKAELDEDLWELTRWSSTPVWAIEALKRGIAVHHSGMNKSYRSLVESLFRIGFCRVLTATGTLALGINMPCKVSIFCGDSVFLTALSYRQCAGRSGRRGFDLLGKVVFYGIPEDRIHRLVLSRIPPLSGHFPLTTTLSLRLFNLVTGSEYAPTAVDAIRSILSLPRLTVASENSREEVLHHLRFSIEYLIRSRLLDSSGRVLSPWFGIAAHLYHTEPSNFALIALFRYGVFHNICATNTIDAQRNIVHLLSHLFGRVYIPRSTLRPEYLAKLREKYPSKILLPPLPEVARQVLVQHNEEILDIFSAYALTYASQYATQLGPDERFPLSNKNVGPVEEVTDSPFLSSLRSTAIRVTVRSPFVANSGHGDMFTSVGELVRCSRSGLHLNKHAIPTLDLIDPSDVEESRTLNSYLLDFFVHGQVTSLVNANGIRRGDVWYLLQDFSLTLGTIIASMEQLMKDFGGGAESDGDSEDDTDDGDDDGSTNVEIKERTEEEEAALAAGLEGPVPKPGPVSEADYHVYKTIFAVKMEFDEKWRAMWA